MNHIDGDSDNNKVSNLRLLCPNCHTQTPNFEVRSRYKKISNEFISTNIKVTQCLVS